MARRDPHSVFKHSLMAYLVKSGAIKLDGLLSPIQGKEMPTSKLVQTVEKFMSEGHSFEDAHALADLKLGRGQSKPSAQAAPPASKKGYGGLLGTLYRSGKFKKNSKIDNRDLAEYTTVAAADVMLSNGVRDGVLRRVSWGVYRFN